MSNHEDTVTLLREVCLALDELYCGKVSGIMIFGSRTRHTFASQSDLDVLALVETDWREQRFLEIDGISIDMFVAPEAFYRNLLMYRTAGIVTILAHGNIVLDKNATLGALQLEALRVDKMGPPTLREGERFRITRDLDQITSAARQAFLDGDTASATVLAFSLVDRIVDLHFRFARYWPRRPKQKYRELKGDFPEIFALVADFANASPDQRLNHATKIMFTVLTEIFGDATSPRAGPRVKATWPPENQY